MPSDALKYALAYAKMGYSVIPCRPDKKPYIQWKDYQYKRASKNELEAWWEKYPTANVGIVTGDISGVDVVDCDTQDAYNLISDEYLSESFETPIVKTPKGYHIWFAHRAGLGNGVRVIPGTDLRTTGGYVVCPPSRNGSGNAYMWLENLSPSKIKPQPMPNYLFDVLQQGSKAVEQSDKKECYTKQTVTNRNISFIEGGRNDSLFHLAWSLRKAGMPVNEISQYAHQLGASCCPPLSPEEIDIIIRSSADRKQRSETGITQAIHRFIDASSGWFNIQECFKEVSDHYGDSAERSSVRALLHRMAKERKLIERDTTRNGFFRKLETECEVINFLDCTATPIPLDLPLGLPELVEVYPGNVIMVAGVSNMGKTAFLIDCIARNMDKMDVWYFNSEMDGKELSKRLTGYRTINSLYDWKFNSREVVENMEDVIAQGEGKVNIIDYLELDEEHFKISGMIRRIHKRLNGAIAIIAIQKKPGTEVGVGGYGTIYKARLALNIEKGVCSIFKAKNWRSQRNPNGLKIKFDIRDGWDLCGHGGWYRDGE
jgi:hypothetical protein